MAQWAPLFLKSLPAVWKPNNNSPEQEDKKNNLNRTTRYVGSNGPVGPHLFWNPTADTGFNHEHTKNTLIITENTRF